MSEPDPRDLLIYELSRDLDICIDNMKDPEIPNHTIALTAHYAERVQNFYKINNLPDVMEELRLLKRLKGVVRSYLHTVQNGNQEGQEWWMDLIKTTIAQLKEIDEQRN